MPNTFSIVYEFDQVSEEDSEEQKFLKDIIDCLKISAVGDKCIEFIFVSDKQLTSESISYLPELFSNLNFELNISFLISESPGYYEKKKTGYEASSGDVVIFLDSDCIYSKDYFDMVLSGFSSSEVGIVSGRTFALIETRRDLLLALLWQFPIEGTVDPRNSIVHKWGNNFAVKREILNLSGFQTLRPARPTFRVLGFVWDSQVEMSCKRKFVDADAFHKQFSSFKELSGRVYEQGRETQTIAKWSGVSLSSRIKHSFNGMGWNSMNRISTLRTELSLGMSTRSILSLGVFILRASNTLGYLSSIILDRKIIIK